MTARPTTRWVGTLTVNDRGRRHRLLLPASSEVTIIRRTLPATPPTVTGRFWASSTSRVWTGSTPRLWADDTPATLTVSYTDDTPVLYADDTPVEYAS